MPNFLERILAGVALLVLSPLLAVISALILRDSGTPIFFTQVRVGKGGRPFRICKFRTMAPRSSSGPLITVSGDPRVTPLGRRLRSSKLDELPQLWNVVRGDMALVGPRPELPVYAVSWPADSRDVILSVRPGITDPMTVELRREEELLATQPDPMTFYLRELLPVKAAGYVHYIENKSLVGDLRVLIQTAEAVLRH